MRRIARAQRVPRVRAVGSVRLHVVNVREVAPIRFGTWMGGAYNFIDQNIFSGKLPFKLTDPVPDHETLKPAADSKVIEYPKPDGILSFDKTSSVYLSSTNHEEDQPVHLRLTEPDKAVALQTFFRTRAAILSGWSLRVCEYRQRS